jgi:hypothetical protein
VTRACVDCGRAFDAEPDEPWKTRCLGCFKRHKRAEERGDWEPGWKRRARPPEGPVERLSRAAGATVAEAFAAGRKEGYDAGLAEGRRRPSPVRLDAELLRELVALTHPDRHPPERFKQANDATTKLLALLDGNARRAA